MEVVRISVAVVLAVVQGLVPALVLEVVRADVRADARVIFNPQRLSKGFSLGHIINFRFILDS